MAKRLLLVPLALVLACGGSDRRPEPPEPRRPRPSPSSAEQPPGATAPEAQSHAIETPPAPEPLSGLPPFSITAPIIRVGLDTAATAVRLTASQPFRIGTADAAVETADVIVSGEPSFREGGFVFRVQVASFPDREAAQTARISLSEELGERVVLEREPATGRYALRVGDFSTSTGAEAHRDELVRRGFEGAYPARAPATGSPIAAIVLEPRAQSPLRIPAVSVRVVPASTESFIEVDGRPYRGYLDILVNRSNRLTLVNVVELEDYLRGVVPAELSPDVFPETEALKAQAIAARTYATKRLGEYEREGFDICATPACQVYRGVSVERPMSDEAVRETAGEILTYQGEPVDALYTSTCGGRTEAAENVFTTSAPYLVSRACALERRMPAIRTAGAAPRSLEAAVLSVLGVDYETAPITRPGFSALVNDVLSRLGQSSCLGSVSVSESAPLDLPALAGVLADALCWERRASFLMSPADAERLVALSGLSETERLELAFAIQEGLIRPPGEGIRRGVPVSRPDVIGTLYRLIERYGESLWREGRVVALAGDARRIEIDLEDSDEAADDGSLTLPIAENLYLFREPRDGTNAYFVPGLSLMPGDRVSFHTASNEHVDVLIAHGTGASFDRSSRFSNWTVRRTAEELSAQVASQEPGLGDVLELRPKRYGRSGRLAELEILGESGTATVRGLAIRRVLGLRENLFFFDRQQGASGSPTGWVFTGRGWGHGVGLCQVGAYGMAASGYDYRAILRHYYPGTELVEHVDKGTTRP